MRRITTRTPQQDADSTAYREAVAVLLRALRGLQGGDFEVRIPSLGDAPDLAELRDELNTFIDINDAFVRESAASLAAASRGEYHRRFLTRGLHGAHRNAAQQINTARRQMNDAADALAAGETERATLAERVQEVAVQVAAASTELGASADTLATSARRVVGRTEAAVATVETLVDASRQIQDAVVLIKHIAAQTRLLALNATIEAARAAEAGRGFAVVAGEVKTLADLVNQSSDDIADQVTSAQRSASDAAEAIHDIASLIAEMDRQVEGVAAAANGGLANQAGLSQMAEALRGEIVRLANG